VAAKNLRLTVRKPWVTGLYEGMVAATTISKQPLEQANWLALNLLDVTLTSALKAYLVNEVDEEISGAQMRVRLLRTPRASPALKAQIPLPEIIWTKIENLARRLDDLTYGRAVPNVTDIELANAEKLIDGVLKRLFKIELDA
jgi:hypothetical protein